MKILTRLLSISPTLIELTGGQQRDALEGMRSVSLLKAPVAAWERPAITTLGPNNHAIRTERWRYIRYVDDGEEFYNHTRVYDERHNLAGDPHWAETKLELA